MSGEISSTNPPNPEPTPVGEPAEITQATSGNKHDAGTRSSNDPTTEIHTTASLPNTYPPQPNAAVHVAWCVIAKANGPDPAVMTTVTDTIHLDTTLTNYVTDVPTAAQTVLNLWQQWANYTVATFNGDPMATPTGLAADVEIHWSIRLDNPTAPAPSMGAWVQAKQHMDGHLTWWNVANDPKSALNGIANPIMQNIPFMRSIAKY